MMPPEGINAGLAHTLVIAEAGSCHDGELAKARQLVRVAKLAGADFVKFQYWSSPRRMAERRRALDYLAVYSQYAIPDWWIPTLKSEADSHGIGFMCASYLPEDVDTVAPHVAMLKVASFESADPVHIVAHARWITAERPLVVSLGLGHRSDSIRRWLAPHLQTGRVICLHCVSAYPTPLEHVHLRQLLMSERSYNDDIGRGTMWETRDGLSDHTPPDCMLAGAMAVAQGARVIERHIRLSETDARNPDAPHAQEPWQFQRYVQTVRMAEMIMGPAGDMGAANPAEAEMRRYDVRGIALRTEETE